MDLEGAEGASVVTYRIVSKGGLSEGDGHKEGGGTGPGFILVKEGAFLLNYV